MNMLLAAVTALSVTRLSTASTDYLVEVESPEPSIRIEVSDGTFGAAGSAVNGRRKFAGLAIRRVRVGTGRNVAEATANLGEAEARVDADGKVWTSGTAKVTAPRFTSVSASRLTLEVDPEAGATVEIEGKTELSDANWEPARRGHRFFRAVQR